jgi:hypothetical protein
MTNSSSFALELARRTMRAAGGTTVPEVPKVPGVPGVDGKEQQTLIAVSPIGPVEIDPLTGKPKTADGTAAPVGPSANPMVAAAMEMVGSGGGGDGGSNFGGSDSSGSAGDVNGSGYGGGSGDAPGNTGGSPAGDGTGVMARGGMAKNGKTKRVMPHVGAIHSHVAGRTDHLPMHVKSGSYVVPADIISAMGEGNTMAGFKTAKILFGGNPYKGGNVYEQGKSPYNAQLPGKAEGGEVSDGNLVPIIAAGGEYVIPPEAVVQLGKGDLDHGHQILDSFVKKMRAKTIKTLSKLPGPKKD